MSGDLMPALIATEIPKLSPDEIDTLSTDERRAETFLLYSTGWTQAQIARKMGVAQSTVSTDIKIEMQRRRTRGQNIEDEIERIAGVVENVMTKAWVRHNEAAESNINSVAATNYLKIVLEAADRYAHIRGFDAVRPGGNTPAGKTRVIVQIGGSRESPEIAVGLES